MFRSLWNLVRALGYLVTGRLNKATEALRSKPAVVGATYDRIISEKTGQINQYKDAIGSMIAQKKKKADQAKALDVEATRLTKLKAGAAAKAKKRVAALGNDKAACQADAEYMKCQGAYKDFSSTLAEKEERIAQLTADVTGLDNNIDGHKVSIQSLLRGLEGLKTEKHDTIGDMIGAQEEQRIADMMAGISEDRTSEELAGLRDLRDKSLAKAEVSRELAGLDTARAEQDFMNELETSEAGDEFDDLIFGGDEKEAVTAVDDQAVQSPAEKIPES